MFINGPKVIYFDFCSFLFVITHAWIGCTVAYILNWMSAWCGLCFVSPAVVWSLFFLSLVCQVVASLLVCWVCLLLCRVRGLSLVVLLVFVGLLPSFLIKRFCSKKLNVYTEMRKKKKFSGPVSILLLV